MLEGYRAAIFDCDGVLLDSTEAKMNAFAGALAGEPADAVQIFLAFQRANWGVSRYKSLNWFYKDVLGASDAPTLAAAAIARFGALSRQALLDCPEMPGMRQYISALQQAGIPAFVATGGDEEEVRAVFAARGLSPFFRCILGSPRTKTDNVRLLIARGDVNGRAMFFGDARADYESARACDMDFTLITLRSDWADGVAICREEGWPVFRDLSHALEG